MKRHLKTFFYTVNILLYLVVLAVWISIPDELTLALITSAITILLTCGLIILDRERLKSFYMSSQFRSLSSSLITIVLIFIIMGFINYFGYKHPINIDLSNFRTHSLSDQSVKSVTNIDKVINVKAFAKKKILPLIKKLMDLYQFENSNIEVEYIDEELRPDLVSKFKIKKSGTIIITDGKRTKVVTVLDELHITNAFIQVTRKKNPVVALVSGHGELQENYDFVKLLIKNSNFTLTSLPLITISEIPTSINTLILWGPKNGLSDQEVSTLDRYLLRGGDLMLSLNPDLTGDKFKNLRSLLEKRGLYIANDLVIDRLKNINGSNGTIPMVDRFPGKSPIIKGFKGPVFFPLASSIQYSRTGAIKGKYESLAKTLPFPASWAESNVDEILNGKISFNLNKDIRGPISLAGTWEETVKEGQRGSKISLFGNSTFVSDAYKKYSSNFTLFINTLNWSTGDLKLISLNMPILKDDPVFISKPQLGIIFYFSVIVAPLILFIMAFVFYRRRSFL
ncbi:MAG: GldG family protein [Bacteriovoracaceae bacterium]|jgi:hypothetical protein|nr:GldG family protein [Bacteriovoracaceae bacterium]